MGALLRQFAKAAVRAGTEDDLIRERPARWVMASLVPEMAAADRLWSLSDELSLYRCLHRSVLAFRELLWQDTEFSVLHTKRSVHRWSELCLSRVPEAEVKKLYSDQACAYIVSVAPSRLKHSHGEMGALAARTSQRGEVVGAYCGMLS